MANSKRRGKLVLKDGTVLEGESFGADVAIVGECVFQTGINIIDNLLMKEAL